MEIVSLDHVQIAIPPHSEQRAVDFYCGILGFEQIPKPLPMRSSGGVWLRAGSVELHLGVEADFPPVRKAHVGLAVDDLQGFGERLVGAGHLIEWDERYPGVERFYVSDPFGNRLELLHAG